MSSDVAWAVVRNNSCHLLKARNVKRPFSTDSFNLTGKQSQRYSGFAARKAVSVQPASDNKGFVVVLKKPAKAHRPGKSTASTAHKSGARSALTSLKNTLLKQRYRKDLTKAALRKASLIIRSQKPLPKRKGAKAKPKAKAAAKKTE